MENLHQEVTLDIFSRLPAESVLQCRWVCRTWRNLLVLDTNFADMHLRRQLLQLDYYQNPSNDFPAAVAADKLGFLFLALEKSSPLCYIEYDENEMSYRTIKNGKYYKTVKRINLPPIKKPNNQSSKIAMVGSCNGLVCVPYPSGINDPVYICNPITSEYINLPKFNFLQEFKGVNIDRRLSCNHGRMVSGFGYHPSTNEYKVVRIIYYEKSARQYTGRVQVYTLGGGSGWRNKGEIRYSLIPHTLIPSGVRGILANGALYWLDYQEMKIVAFDLAEEEFSLLPFPPCFHPGSYMCNDKFKLRAVGGCLCVIHESGVSLDIWSLKKKSCEWEIMWSIPYEGTWNAYWPVTLTKMGEVLLRFGKKTLLHYEQKTATIAKSEDLDTDLCFIEVLPHMNSFVSLKALGERSSTRR